MLLNDKILVLGGTGFIGTHLVRSLVASGKRVRVLSRTGKDQCQFVHDVEYRQVDLSDSTGIAEALVDIDIVVHLISTTVPTTANLDPIADIKGNLLGTVQLLKMMHSVGTSRLVYLSSGGTVYGDPRLIPTPENHERNPLSSYGIVKVAIENYIEMFSALYGLDALVIRASNPYGPYQGHFGVQGVIPTFFQRIIAGDEIRIWGDGSTIRDYLYISDLVSLIERGINKNLTGVYNAGSGQGVSLIDVLSLVEEISGRFADIQYVTSRGFDVQKVVLDISKVCNALEWAPKIPLRDGCERYWKWVNGEGRGV